MPDSPLGDGLILEDSLPLAWSPGPLVDGPALVRMNADNHQLLVAEASLDDVRVHDALKDESPALVHELQRLEFKLNILLRLTAELAVRSSSLPPPQRVRISSAGLEWFADAAPALRDTGVVSAYINAALPQPLRVCCTVVGERMVDGERVVQLRFEGQSDIVADSLAKLIFRHHRRSVAGSRTATR
ncbi:MAG TPA: PilZ domain-containing protein [Steroidobacteraceae bacterium]|nr:PilZ domain-containing protein [Steroidobacteraceae bacterium]